MESISRRSFLAGTTLMAAGITGVALSGCAPSTGNGNTTPATASQATPADITWDQEADVVIVGSGAAGLSAALEAQAAGSSVIILESQIWAGGSTSLNGGLIAGHQTRVAKKLGVDITTRQVLDWFDESAVAQTTYAGDPVPEILKIVGERGGETIDWLQDQGVDFQEKVGVEPDYCPMPVFHYVDNGGKFITPLVDKLSTLGIEIQLETRATRLYTSENGRVIGLSANQKGNILNYRANKAVVLATGGYASNDKLLEQIAPSWAGVFSCMSPGAQGDGLVMGTAIGAASRRTAMMPILIPALEVTSNLIFNWYALEDGGIVVDSKAQRFMDEGADYIDGAAPRIILQHMREIGDDCVWMIVHEGERTLMSLSIYPMDLARAETIEELAALAGLDPSALKASTDAWNALVASGTDTEFGRTIMMESLVPPFIAAKVRPATAMVCGGLHTNANAEVLKWSALDNAEVVEPIEGLYSAGEASGWNARGGWSCCACFTMGRVAGQNAAALESWA